MAFALRELLGRGRVAKLVSIENELRNGGEEGVPRLVAEDEEEGLGELEDLVLGEEAVFVVVVKVEEKLWKGDWGQSVSVRAATRRLIDPPMLSIRPAPMMLSRPETMSCSERAPLDERSQWNCNRPKMSVPTNRAEALKKGH